MVSKAILSEPVYNVETDGISYRNASISDLRDRGLSEDLILAAVKKRLTTEVDTQAEARRASVTTPGAGQAMEYQQAQVEAFDALASTGVPSAASYPMLAASVGLDVDPQTGKPATDVLGVARSVKAAFAAWLAFGAAIRGVRLAAKASIDASTSVDDAFAVFGALEWPQV